MKITNIEQFIYDNKIKCDDLGNVYVKVNGNGFQFAPIKNLEECILITKEQLQGVLNKTLKYDAETNTFNEVKDFSNERKRIKELKQKLSNTDYQAIKYFEGMVGEEEYKSIKYLRQSWRDEINRLEEVISNG